MAEMCVSIHGVESLRHELDRTRENLRDTDATIEKLVGRPGFANRPFVRRPPPLKPGDEVHGRVGNSALFNLAGYNTSTGPPAAKRFASGAFSRLRLPISDGVRARRARDEDEDDELPHKPSIQSSVIATPKEAKSRQDAIAEQESSGASGSRTHNRRMFGLLMGTLVQFRQDEQMKEQQAEKRKAVERRLEDKQHEERERVKRERQQLFIDRRNHQVKLRALQRKMELVEIHEAWESQTHNLEHFIRTAARPHIFYLPKTHVPTSAAKLDESKRVLRQIVFERRKLLEEEINELMTKEEHGKDDVADDGEEGDGMEATDDSMAIELKESKNKPKTSAADPESDLEDDNGVALDYGIVRESSTAEQAIGDGGDVKTAVDEPAVGAGDTVDEERGGGDAHSKRRHTSDRDRDLTSRSDRDKRRERRDRSHERGRDRERRRDRSKDRDDDRSRRRKHSESSRDRRRRKDKDDRRHGSRKRSESKHRRRPRDENRQSRDEQPRDTEHEKAKEKEQDVNTDEKLDDTEQPAVDSATTALDSATTAGDSATEVPSAVDQEAPMEADDVEK